MYIHVFAFRWKAGTSEPQKQRVAADIAGFQGQIEQYFVAGAFCRLEPFV